jgi:hypothetical protein
VSGAVPQHKRFGGGHTTAEVANAVKAEATTVPLVEKIRGLREKGLTEQQILAAADAFLEK